MALSLIPSTMLCIVTALITLWFSQSFAISPSLQQALNLILALSAVGVIGNMFCVFEILSLDKDKNV
jgi:hypothetical protein